MNGNAYDRGDYNSSFALRAVELKTVLPLFLGCFYPMLFILAGNDDMHEKFGQIRLLTVELAALEKIPIDI